MGQPRDRGGLGGPMILIALGVLLLLDNLGVLDFDFWGMLFRLWPLLLVIAGIDLLVGRRSGWGALLALILIGGVLAAGIWLYRTGGAAGRPPDGPSLSQPLEQLRSAQVRLSPGVGRLSVRALDDSADLVSVTLGGWRPDQVAENYGQAGDRATFELRTVVDGLDLLPFSSSQRAWEVGLTPEIPLDLAFDLGVGEASLDLSGLQVASLDVDVGVGRAVLTLPAEGEFEASIDGGVGQVVILVPPGLGVRLQSEGGLSYRDIPEGFEPQGEAYLSPGYEAARSRVDLRVSQGIGGVEVRQMDDGR